MTERLLPKPAVTSDVKPFWDAAERGELLVKTCKSCGKLHYYPRAHCPYCMSGETEWAQVSGRGTIYSYSVMRRAPQPFAIAYVALEEGITVLSNIVDCDLDKLAIGQKVALTFAKTDGGPQVPVFKPA